MPLDISKNIRKGINTIQLGSLVNKLDRINIIKDRFQTAEAYDARYVFCILHIQKRTIEDIIASTFK